jgi:hypothetical protein
MRKVVFLLALALTAPASAQTVKGQDPQSVVKAMQAAGYAAKLTTDKAGDPLIESSSSGSSFQTFFYNCKDNKDCATVQFHASYQTKTAPTLQKLNEWNASQRFGRAYLNGSGYPAVEMDVDLDDGGMSSALFTDNLEFWIAIMAQFEKHIGW